MLQLLLDLTLEDLDIAHYRLLNARKKAEENGASQEELDALQKDIDDNRAKYKQVAKAKKKLNQQRAKERKLYGDPNEERRDHIKVWSGAGQAYDRVDLAFVGTGTGGNNEGRGAYSSGVRGVAQERYARYKVEDWKRAQGDGGFAPEDVPIVYDGKPMRLEDAVSIAVQKIAYAQAKGLSPAEEDLAVKRIYEDAYNYYSDNGFIDYDEFREYVRSIHVRPSRYEDTLFQIEEIEKIMAYPREKRMMYHRESLAGTPREWDSEARFGISNVGEIRDVYAISDGLGTTEYVDVAYVQNEYEEAKGKLEASKEDQKALRG